MEVGEILALTTNPRGGINVVQSGCIKKKIPPVISRDLLRSSASIHKYVNTTIPTCLMINIGVNLVLMLVDVMMEQMVVVVVLALDVHRKVT